MDELRYDMNHGDQAVCSRCWEIITYRSDRATPYWEHPNRFPYCRNVNDPAADPGPAEPTE